MADIRTLDKLATWMRKVGAVRARAGDVELELGPAPTAMAEAKPMSDDEVLRQAKLNAQQLEGYLFAASEGFPEEVKDS